MGLVAFFCCPCCGRQFALAREYASQPLSSARRLDRDRIYYAARQIIGSGHTLLSFPYTPVYAERAGRGSNCFRGFCKRNMSFASAFHSFSNIHHHNEKEQPKCATCGTISRNVDELEIHITVDHLDWVPFHCYYCQFVRLPTEFTLRTHLKEQHPDRDVMVSSFFSN
jgi:hypothetical protein